MGKHAPVHLPAQSRQSFLFVIKPVTPASAVNGAAGAAGALHPHTSIDMLFSLIWTAESLLSPIACQFHLAQIGARQLDFFVSARHSESIISVGDTVEVTFTITNMTQTARDLSLVLSPPRLADQLPTARLVSRHFVGGDTVE